MRRRGFLGAILGALTAPFARAAAPGLSRLEGANVTLIDDGTTTAIMRGTSGLLCENYRQEFVAGFDARAALLEEIRSDVNIHAGGITWVCEEHGPTISPPSATRFPKGLLP